MTIPADFCEQEGADLARIHKIRGSLIRDPTLASAFPHGGTRLGIMGQIAWRLRPNRGDVTAQEYCGQVVEVIEGAHNLVVAATLRMYDSAAISALFPGAATGGSGEQLVSHTMTTNVGGLGSARAIALLVAPGDPATQQALYIPRAVPLLEETLNASWSLEKEWGLTVVFQGLPDATGRCYQLGYLEDMTV